MLGIYFHIVPEEPNSILIILFTFQMDQFFKVTDVIVHNSVIFTLSGAENSHTFNSE